MSLKVGWKIFTTGNKIAISIVKSGALVFNDRIGLPANGDIIRSFFYADELENLAY